MGISLKLIKKSVKGNRKAQKELFDYYYRIAFRLCFRYMKSVDKTEDVVSMGFVSVFENLHRVEFISEKAFTGWLKKIMVNQALNDLRKEKFDVSLDTLSEMEDDKLGDDNLNMQDIHKAISSLPGQYGIVFNLHAIEGYKHKEIAEMLNIGISNSKIIYHRARLQLQYILKERTDYAVAGRENG